ncbi:hypothetical protein RB195_015019 [Necator americanus]|uniref:Leucine Rich repeat-containing domain protein n=1 Tax=Necator americanus TaxID=51031 RepID=A0ABR1E5A2_NECAM
MEAVTNMYDMTRRVTMHDAGGDLKAKLDQIEADDEEVTGSCLKLVLQRCRKLKSLFLAHTTLDNTTIKAIEWEKTRIEELDVKGTELLSDTLISLLTRLPYLRWLDASWLENMTDQELELFPLLFLKRLGTGQQNQGNGKESPDGFSANASET